MKVKAIQSFIGKISMNINDEREIIDRKLAEDLIKAGYVIEMKANKIAEPIKEVKQKTTKKKKSKK